MMEEGSPGDQHPAEIAARHEALRDTMLTERERQDRQDVERLLAEVERVRALLAGVVGEFPAGADSAALEAARAYLAETGDERAATRGGV